MYDYKIINGQVYQNGSFVATNLYLSGGRIAAISTEELEANQSFDCQGDLVIPGIIDPHTHLALDLGFIQSVDDFHSGTIAAAFGGVTTIVDFLDPVATSEELIKAFDHRMEQAKDAVIDVKFHACLANPTDSLDEITDVMLDRKMNTVKIFTTYSESNRRTYDPEIRRLLELSKEKGFVVAAHIENDDMIVRDDNAPFQALPDVRPTISETSEALKLAGMVEETGGTLYMVHCSSGETLQALQKKYPTLLHQNFFVETCPHYVVFDRAKLLEDDGYLFTMAPPLRSANEQLLLRELISEVDTIGTDHCVFLSEDKKQKLLSMMPLGVTGLEESFRIMHTLFGHSIIDKMTKNVAKIHNLYPQKGTLEVGSDADLFVYHLEPSIIKSFHGASDYSIYDGVPVDGRVVATMSRGRFVVKNGKFIAHQGQRLHPGGK